MGGQRRVGETDGRSLRFAESSCRLWIIVAATATLLAPACSPRGSPTTHLPPDNLLFATPPLRLLDEDSLLERTALGRTDFAIPDEREGWALEAGVWTELGACGASAAGQVAVRNSVPHDLSTASTLEVRVTHMEGGYLELVWRAGQPPGEVRQTTRIHWNAALGELHERYRFDLRSIAGRRAGDSVVLRTRPDPSRRPCLEELIWSVAAIDPERLAETRRDGARLLLGTDVRDARIADATAPIVVALPGGARVARLGVVAGIWGRSTHPVTFAVETQSSGSESIAISSFEIPADQGGRWLERTIDLPPALVPGTRLVLRATECAAPVAGFCLPVWSDLRLLSETREARPGPPDIVLISVDTLRADRMSLYGAAVQTTPRIDAWARRNATVFEWAISSAGWTLPAHVSMLSGLDSVRHGVNTARRIPDSVPLGPELLRRGGYRTEAVVGGGYLDPRFGFHRGFDVYRSWRGATAGRNELAFVVDAARTALSHDDPRPLFLFVHTYEVHPPLRARDGCPGLTMAVRGAEQLTVQELPAGERNGRGEGSRWMIGESGHSGSRAPLPADRAELVAQLYDCGVHSMDRSIGKLLDEIERRRADRPTLVVLTSDHGESFSEHAVAGHGLLYDDNLHVPLLISSSDRVGAGTRVPTQVRLVDVLPTLLNAAGIRSPDPLDGAALRTATRAADPGAPALAYSDQLGLALRVGNRMKFLFWDRLDRERATRDRLFDLRADPGEAVDLRASSSERDAWISLAARSTSRLPGLALRIPPSPSLELMELRADWLRPDLVRWAGPPVEGVHFDETGRISIPGPIARPIELRATVAPDDARGIEIRGRHLDRAGAAFERIEPLDFRSSVRREIRLASASSGGVRPGDPLLLSIEWTGLASGAKRESVDDQAAIDQLRALGYLQ